MPRLNTDYSKTQIYRFVCNDLTITNTYVGSTTCWSNRKASHKMRCNNINNEKHTYNIYQVIRENGGWINWKMILIEDFPCDDKEHAVQREQYWKDHFNDKMGTHRAFITEHQSKERYDTYNTKNKEMIKEKRRLKYLKSKENKLVNKV